MHSSSALEKHYIQRIIANLHPEATSIVNFIAQETFLNLKRFTYVGHEYQQYWVELIEKDPNVDITAEKCSQIGLSEICFRLVLAKMALIPGYSVLYAMPTKSFSQEVLKTRMAPIIEQAPQLKALISSDVDSASVKMFVNGSILYALGASANSSSSLINRPIVLALTDELDKCDKDTVSAFHSRQTHSLHGKPKIAISTPTAPGIGINAKAEERQIHRQLVICHHCGHEFFPDYYKHVCLPGFDAPLQTLTEEKVRKKGLRLESAFFFCPKCRKKPALTPEHRRWDIQNQERDKIHVRLTPFDAPSFITASDLVTSQVTYSSEAEFRNQALGLTSSIADATIDRTKITFTREEIPTGPQVAGLDLGKLNHMLCGILADDILFIHSPKLILLRDLRKEVEFTIRQRQIISMVSDSLPYSDIVNDLTDRFPQFWGAAYNVPLTVQPELYKIKVKEADDSGIGNIRQVIIQKNLFMDHVASMLVSGQIVFKSSEYDETIIQHILDMRRVRDPKFSETRYKWVKSSRGVDHFFHTLVYLVAASRLIRKTQSNYLPMATMLATFKNKSPL